MSQNGNTQNSLAIQKKNLLNQKIGNTFYSNLEFAHISAGGESVINFNSLTAPSEAVSLEGFSNPQPSELIGAKITQNRGNVRLHSSLRGDLQRFTQFFIREDNQIRLTFETAENEIITGMINNVVRTVPSVLDVKKISFTGELAEGVSEVVIGAEYNINANSSTQLGDIVVYRWQGNETPKLMVRCEGNDILNDGNYIEKLNAIEFKESGRTGGENIAVFSPNCVPTEYQNSFKSDLETLGGQVDIISEFLQDIHALPTNIFQVAPNQVDLRAFGQKVIDLFGVIFGAVAIPASFLAKLNSVNNIYKVQTKWLQSDITADNFDVSDLRFNNLKPGKMYRVTLRMRCQGSTTPDEIVGDIIDGNGRKLIYSNMYFEGGTPSLSSSRTFIAQHSTLITRFTNLQVNNSVMGNGASDEETFVQLEEIPNGQVTAQWT